MSPTLLSTVLAIFGIVLLLISIVIYYIRTKDEKLWQRFWLGKELLTKNEYILNRGEFWLAIIGIILMYVFRNSIR